MADEFLDSVGEIRRAFYRLVGTESDDPDLEFRGEDEDEVVNYFLTIGARAAQRYLIDNGFKGWIKRSSALSWNGTDAANGGRYASLPDDFMRANGRVGRRSPLVKAGGDRWGALIEEEDSHYEGDFCYVRHPYIWLARTASPPTLYLEYFYMHPFFDADVTIDFPSEARFLIPAEAASAAADDEWLPGGQEMKVTIEASLRKARDRARKIARQTRSPRQWLKPRMAGRRY